MAKDDLNNEIDNIKEMLKEIYNENTYYDDDDLYTSFNFDDFKGLLESSSVDLDRINLNLSEEECKNLDKGKYKRSNQQSFTSEKVSITYYKNNYILAHLTNADLSMLSDFDEIKNELNIVNKSFVTLTKPIILDGVRVFIRDTMLLAPGSKKSLESIGSLYEGIEKIEIPNGYKNNMVKLLKDDPVLFTKYALRDSLIALVHGCYMEYFNNSLGGVGIPLTLSSLSSKYIKKF
jgi:hypothetical protein